MNRRRRTVKFGSFHSSSAHLRLSMPELAANSLVLDPEHIVRELLHDIFTEMEQQIEWQRSASISSQLLLTSLDKAFANWYQLEQLAYEPHSLSLCESEPQASGQSQRPNDATRAQVRRMARREESSRWANEKSQSCDIGQWQRRQKIERGQLPTQRSSHRQLVSLMQNSRSSENEDRSQEIQSLLRRKKELQMESKQPQRVPSDAGRPVLIDKKEKKWFWQDDEGGVVELLSQIKSTKDSIPAIQLANIKVLPGQQLAFPSNFKRRPIVELPTRKTKRRKDIGDTCILIEQLYETDGARNQEEIIEQAFRAQKGVRIEAKDKAITSILKLPTLR